MHRLCLDRVPADIRGGLIDVQLNLAPARPGNFADEVACLTESANEAWTNAIPITSPRPQPDHAAGFEQVTFTSEWHRKLRPLVGDLKEEPYFMATYQLYFPFLICEVQSSIAALDVAD